LPFERYQAAVLPSPVIDLADGYSAYYQALKVVRASFLQRCGP